jgi:hypothetical protein
VAATILVKEALWRVGVLLNDTDPQFERYTERELIDWANDAQLAIAKFLLIASSRVDSIRLKPGVRQSLESIAPADIVPGDGITPLSAVLGTSLIAVSCNMGANGSTPGDAVRLIDSEVLDAQDRAWRTRSGTKIKHYIYDPATPRYFYVDPAVPPSQNVWAEIAWNAQPRKIPAGGDPGTPIYHYAGASAVTLSVHDEHIDDVVNYIVARALMKNSGVTDDGRAGSFVSLFVNSLNAKVEVATGHNPNLKRLPLAPQPLGAAS